MRPNSKAGSNRATGWWLSAAILVVISIAAVLSGIMKAPASKKSPSRGTRDPGDASFLPVQSKSSKDLGVGKVLIASRDLGDQNFTETAVLIVHYDAKSVAGLVLNRRTDVPISRVFQTLEAAKRRSDLVYLGGPVEDSVIFALLRSQTKLDDADPVFEDLYMISSKTRLEKTIADGAGSSAFHLYLGYAGWTNEQLKAEVEAGAWHIFQADEGMVFDSDPDSLWPRMIRKTEEKIAGRFGILSLAKSEGVGFSRE